MVKKCCTIVAVAVGSGEVNKVVVRWLITVGAIIVVLACLVSNLHPSSIPVSYWEPYRKIRGNEMLGGDQRKDGSRWKACCALIHSVADSTPKNRA